MKTYLLNLWDTMRSSYWFVPSLCATGALVLAFVMPLLDATIVESGGRLPEWIQTTTPTARATLSAMAGAMVGVTGTVFSITIVTLSLTSQQFGPRLLRRFMYDLPTQVTLGVFLATGFYCLLILRVVEHHDGGAVSVPHLAVLVAVALTAVSMALLIVFIHHVAMLIQAPQVVAAVASDLDDSIVRLFPETLGEFTGDVDRYNATACEEETRLGENCITIRSEHTGYIQAVDMEGLMSLACGRELVVRLLSRPGDFIAAGTRIAKVWPADATSSDERNADELAPLLNDVIIVGVRRTPRQDVECAIEELVEVAVRSLSPGINDPFTAMNCIDRLGTALEQLAERKLPAARRSDDTGCLRIIARPISFADVLGAAFNQIRQYGRSSVAVTIRLLEALASVAEHLHRDEDRKAVRHHAEMIARPAESLMEEYDKREILERLRRVNELLGEPPPR